MAPGGQTKINGTPETWQVFTDGSLLEGRSGSGIVIFQNKVHKTSEGYRLQQATVYQSEVKAVEIAAKMLLSMKDGTVKCNIWLDNQAAIYELGKAEITQKCVLDAHNALIKLCKEGTTCDIRWVRGHMGILGNEMSDEAAKLGSKSSIGNLKVPSTIKRKIHEKITSQWTKEWMSDPEWCRQTKCFYTNVDKKKTHALL